MPEPNPTDVLFAQLQDELTSLAGRYLERERPDHTLQPAALVNEVYLKLVRSAPASYDGRSHFLAIAARAMRQVLVDHARAGAALKRGGGAPRVTLDDHMALEVGQLEDVLTVEQALGRLAEQDERAARIVMLRFYGGMTMAEIGRELGLSERWVQQQYTWAIAWLRRLIRF